MQKVGGTELKIGVEVNPPFVGIGNSAHACRGVADEDRGVLSPALFITGRGYPQKFRVFCLLKIIKNAYSVCLQK